MGGGEWTNGKYRQSMGQIVPDLIGQVKDSRICFTKSDRHQGKHVIGFAFIRKVSHSGNMSRLERLLGEAGAELEVLCWTQCKMTAVASTHLVVVGSGEMWEDSEGHVCCLGNRGVEEDIRGVRDEF